MQENAQMQKRSKFAFFTLIGISTAILLATPVLILTGIGFLLDKLFHISPFLTIAGGVIGFFSGTYNVYKLVTRMNNNK